MIDKEQIINGSYTPAGMPSPSLGQVRPGRVEQYFTNKRIGKNMLLILALLLLNKLGESGNVVCYLILLAMAFRNTEWALKALSISGLIIVASDVFVSRGEPVSALKFLLLLVAGLTILRAARQVMGQPFLLSLLIFGVVAALLALINDYYVAVSLLKIASFTFGAFCLLAVARVRKNLAPQMTEWAISLILLVLVLSYLALLLGSGYGVFEAAWGRFSGFRGAFSHPQTMGTMASLFAVYLTSLLLFTKVPNRSGILGMLLALLALLYLSEARTGMFGYLLSIGLLLVLSGFGKQPKAERRLLTRYKRQFLVLAFASVLGVLLWDAFTGNISDKAAEFIAKGEQMNELTLETLYQSRARQIEEAWDTFQQNPMTGIGFGTDDDPRWQNEATLLSASTEKGFLPTALLEEVGIVGAIFFVLFLLMLYSYIIRGRRYVALATLTTLLVLNLGEMMFFAFGGMGMLCWTLIAISMTVRGGHIQPVPVWQPRRRIHR